MDFNSTIDLIIKDLNAASEIIDDLKKYPGVPALQVEYAKSKCKSAGEVIALLKNLTDIPAKNEPVNEKEIRQTPEEPKIKFNPPPVIEEKVKIADPVQSSTLKKEQKTESKITGKKAEDPSTIADKFSSHTDLYEEKLVSTTADHDLSDRLKSKPITNLSDAIGLNDRFLFIREIFDGNKDTYSQAISRLDRAENLQDAMAIIMSYTGEKPENEAVIQLLDLVRLKLPANE